MKVVVTTVDHRYEFFMRDNELFCKIDEKELRGPCMIIGKKSVVIGESIDVICAKEEDDFYTKPVEKVEVKFD